MQAASAKAACAGAAAGCIAALPSEAQIIAAIIGALIGLWGQAVRSWRGGEVWMWAVLLVGQILSAVLLGAAGSVALHRIDPATVTGDGVTAALTLWVIGLPEWLTACALAATSQYTLPLIDRIARRRTAQ